MSESESWSGAPQMQMVVARRLLSSALSPSRRRLFSSSAVMNSLTVDSLNPAIRNVEYAVRGELAIKAEAYRNQLKQPNHGLPFDRVISSNIGNPQQKGLDQQPISFNRQVSHSRSVRPVSACLDRAWLP